MKTLILAMSLLIPPLALGQSGAQRVNLATPSAAEQNVLFYSGTNLQYVCVGMQKATATSVSVAATTLTSIVVATNVATVNTVSVHKLYIGALVTISGATVDTDLNGVYAVVMFYYRPPHTLTLLEACQRYDRQRVDTEGDDVEPPHQRCRMGHQGPKLRLFE